MSLDYKVRIEGKQDGFPIEYEKIFINPKTIYRTDPSNGLHPEAIVDTQTITDYFLFLN